MAQAKSHFVNSSSGLDPHLPTRPQRRRHPLSDTTNRVNNQSTSSQSHLSAHDYSLTINSTDPPPIPHHSSLHPGGTLQNPNRSSSPLSKIEDKRISAVSSEDARASNRLSQLSQTSTNASGKGRRKTHVGPWRLGKTIGKGASGRVRKARHATTGQDVAIKIVSKKSAEDQRSQSLAFIDLKIEPGKRSIPFGIEREVVIMKMIEHPNIIKLFDIWENRGELYLVLEYVEGGELFNHISRHGSLPEHEAVRLFRQIIAALAYCHQFNICHRDLKPENILLDSENNIKIVDFGMAALQPHNKWLKTPCGSPHYASPEVIKSEPYRGDKADVWSCGVILFAMLAGYLPFDARTEDWRDVITAVLEGDYVIPEHLSPEAQNLIACILQPDPKHRISIRRMWDHPLIKKYAHLDSLDENGDAYIGPPAGFTTHDCGPRFKKRADIDNELLRNLHNLWHGVTEEELAERLLSDEPNLEKIVYSKLNRYREDQLEHYEGPPLEASLSDYHHVNRPERMEPVPSIREPTNYLPQSRQSQYSLADHHLQPRGRRDSHAPQRNISIAETAKTASSYDPFRPSKNRIATTPADYARITVLRQASQNTGRRFSASAVGRKQGARLATTEEGDVYSIASSPPAMHSARASQLQRLLANQQRMSRGNSRVTISSNRTGRSASSTFVAHRRASYKRDVSFNWTGRRSVSNDQPRLRDRERRRDSKTLKERYVKDQGDLQILPNSTPASFSPIDLLPVEDQPILRSKKEGAKAVKGLSGAKLHHVANWTDDVRKVSTELDKLCDTAFNRVSVSSSAHTAITPASGNRESQGRHLSSATSFSVYEDPVPEADQRQGNIKMVDASTQAPRSRGSHSRQVTMDPLAQDRLGSYTHRELVRTRQLLEKRNRGSYMEPGYLDDVIAHLDRLMQPSSARVAEEERRAVTDPTSSTGLPRKDTFEQFLENGTLGFRSASEPSKERNKRQKTRRRDGTIRLVEDTSDGYKPISPIKPLTIRKKSGASSATPLSATPTKESRSPHLPPLDLYNHEQGSAGLPRHENSLQSIRETEGSEFPLRHGKDGGGTEMKKRSWFRARPQARNSKDAELGPSPISNHLDAQNEHLEDAENVKRVSATASSESHTSEPKKTIGKGGRFFKMFTTGKRGSKEQRSNGQYNLDDSASFNTEEDSSYAYESRDAQLRQQTGYPIVSNPLRCYPTITTSPQRNRSVLELRDGDGKISYSSRGKDAENSMARTLMPPPPLPPLSRNPPQLPPVQIASPTWPQHNKNNNSTTTFDEKKKKNQKGPLQSRAHNWLARFLGIKPATRVLCFQVSKLKARREVVAIWKEWRKFGMEGIVVDKVGGKVWARVGAGNALNIPPIALSAEFFTLLHQGRRANLAIARFTQEKGAKSSFERVMEALEEVLGGRGVLVMDEGVVGEMRGGAGM